jgi:NAD+ synthetase
MNIDEIRYEVLDLSRQNQIGNLNGWFSNRLDSLIKEGYFPDRPELEVINQTIINNVATYRIETRTATVVLGMSGGVDSALTAAIYKSAGYRVVGVTMPINQAQDETDRGVEACTALGIEHRHIDLSDLYNHTLVAQSELDSQINEEDPTDAVRIRRGNVRARLRMITLYNLASMLGGFVASTDNLSELTAGFWTLHGDVGDLAPVQSLTKSWEIPYLARLNGVPESTVRAKPTDGLGISDGDEAQLGCSYLEWDIMFFSIYEALRNGGTSDVSTLRGELGLSGGLGGQTRQAEVFDAVTRRMGATWFKRKNPLNIKHALQNRYTMVDVVDDALFVPEGAK